MHHLPVFDSITLLIVDDSIENLQVLSSLLGEKYHIKVAKSGVKALQILEMDTDIDLIVLDIMMPDMDGYTVCEKIKNNEKTKSIPVIFITALNESADETRGFDVGGADFITKPFNSDVVQARINTHLALRFEKRKTDALLNILLPPKVLHDLIETGKYAPEHHPIASVLFCDLDNFTSISSVLSPDMLINELTDIFTAFDQVSESNGVMRIKTIGDAYMAVAGVHEFAEDSHADKAVKTGLDFISFLSNRNKQSEIKWTCRVGIHSGPIISGLVGKSRFQFDVMGDNVNIASRVESVGTSMHVTVTDQTRQLLKQSGYRIKDRGAVNLKGKGEIALFDISD